MKNGQNSFFHEIPGEDSLDRNPGDLVRFWAKQSCFGVQPSSHLFLDPKDLETPGGSPVGTDNGGLRMDSAGVRFLVAGCLL